MKGAWVTLATNDSYSLGALVLAHSLKQVGTTQELAILVTPGVTNSMRTRLSEVFNLVQEVNVLDSRDQSNLRLLQRPELGITFTKLHCWRLTQYEKCVFLDADTLVLQNCDELFDREEFSAAPDVGWPDCFNSGVFVYRPSSETYDKLIQFALDKGSFDGGDQGLLNLYFSDWAHKDISKHLPFIYNVCSTAFYSYLPAFKQFGKDVKIIHFIGNAKPWLQYFDTETRKVRPSGDVGHLSTILQRWWDIFCHMVHPNLLTDMSESYPEIVSESTPPQFLQTSYTKPDYPTVHICEAQNVWDPWEEYDKKQLNIPSIDTEPLESHNTNAFSISVTEPSNPYHSVTSIPTFHEFHETQIHQIPNLDNSRNFHIDENNSETHSEPSKNEESSHESSHHENLFFNFNHSEDSVPLVTTGCPYEFSKTPPILDQSGINNEISVSSANDDPFALSPADNFVNQAFSVPPEIDPLHPPSPEIFPPSPSPKALEECETAASINNGETERQNETRDSGLAGAFAKLTLGQQRTPEQEALENTLRRQNWEQGNIDYLGKDSFDNIWSKICETLSKGVQKEEAVGEPQVVTQATTIDPQAETEQQASKQLQSSQEIAVAAETPKEELQASETKESTVAPLQVQEVVISLREEAVSVLPISEKDNEVSLEDKLIQSSETPVSHLTKSTTEVYTTPAIPSDVGLTSTISAPEQSTDVSVTKEKETPKSTPLQTANAGKEPTTSPIEVLEAVSLRSIILPDPASIQTQLPDKTEETGTLCTPPPPVIPQTPPKLEEATQVLLVSEKTSETPVNVCIAEAEGSAKLEPAAIAAAPSVPQSLISSQTPDSVAEQPAIAQTPALVPQSSLEQQVSHSKDAPSLAQTQTHTSTSKISPQEQTSPVTQIPLSSRPKMPPLAQISLPTALSTPTQPPVEVGVASAISPCAEISASVESPQTPDPAKTSSPSAKPADTSLQSASPSLKETVIKQSETPQPHDPAAQSQISSQTKQAPPETKQASTEPKQASTETKQAPTEPKQAPFETKQVPTEPKQTPTEPKQAPPETKQAPTEPKQAPPETKQAPTEPKQAPPETKQAPTEPKQAPAETKQAPAEPKQAPPETKQAPTEPKQAPPSQSTNVDACPIAPPPRKSGGAKKQGKSKK